MLVGDRLRALREQKHLSQGHIENRTGLLRCYVSRVENGHTVPGLDTLEKWARALDVQLYQIFYEGEELPAPSKPVKSNSRLFGFKCTSIPTVRLLLEGTPVVPLIPYRCAC